MGELNLLNKYLVNPTHPVHSSLCYGISQSYFLQNFKTIFVDEEIYNSSDSLERCFICLSEDLQKIVLPINELTSFLRNETSYDYKQRINVSNDILDICKKVKMDEIDITYCKQCGKILELFGIPYIFYFSALDDLHYEQETVFQKENNLSHGEIVFCPRCKSKNMGHMDVYYDERGEVEYDVSCKDCGYNVYHFSYGDTEYIPPCQLNLFHERFDNVLISKDDEEDDDYFEDFPF